MSGPLDNLFLEVNSTADADATAEGETVVESQQDNDDPTELIPAEEEEAEIETDPAASPQDEQAPLTPTEEDEQQQPQYILGLLPFTLDDIAPPYYGLDNPHNVTHSNRAYTHMAAALLAADHFNTRNTAVVPGLAALQNCTFQLPPFRFRNTDGDPFRTSQDLMQLQSTDTDRYNTIHQAMAIVGPYTSEAALTAATYASGLDIPLVSHGVDDITFSRTVDNPRVATTAVNLHAMSEAVVNYALNKMQRSQSLAIVHVIREIGDQYMQAIVSNAKIMASSDGRRRFEEQETHAIGPPFVGTDPGQVGSALQAVKTNGIRNIFLVLNDFQFQLPIVADYAEEYGMNNGDYTWILAGPRTLDLGEVVDVAKRHGTNVTKLANGMAHISLLDGFAAVKTKEDDPFWREWHQQNATFVDRVNQLHPVKKPKNTGYFQAPEDYFQRNDPLPGAGFMYDAVTSVGLGKCIQLKAEMEAAKAPSEEEGPDRAEAENSSGGANGGGAGTGANAGGRRVNVGVNGRASDGGENGDNGKRKTRVRGLQQNNRPIRKRERQLQNTMMGMQNAPLNNFHEAIMDAEFQGATGPVKFRESARVSGSRPRDTVMYGAYNFRQAEGQNDANQLWYYLTDVHYGNPMEGRWEATSHAPFVFANGLTTPPLLNRDLPEQNYLPQSFQITGLTFMAIALLTAILSAIFVQVRKTKDIHIRQAQPPFLMLLILGAMLLSSSIFTLSFDDSYDGWTQSKLDGMCMATPWLVSLGYNSIYLALFCKLRRIDKVMQFRRVEVKVSHVVLPFVASMLAIVAILIGWTVTAPMVWKREEIDSVSHETYGKCQSENSLPFWIPLFCLMALSTVACGLMAFKCRDIAKRYSDTNNIFHTIFAQIQVLLVGIPVTVILGESSAGATYMGKSLLIFVVAMSTLILMILPLVLRTLSRASESETGGSRKRCAATGSVYVAGQHSSKVDRDTSHLRGAACEFSPQGTNDQPPFSGQCAADASPNNPGEASPNGDRTLSTADQLGTVQTGNAVVVPTSDPLSECSQVTV